MYKIILITPSQPSLNPRLVKEADALANSGYEVSVIFSYWNDWGSDFTKKLLPQKKWETIYVGGDPVKKPLIYFISRVIYSLARLVVQKFGPINYLTEIAASRSSYFLIRKAKKNKADLYIAHNLGALAPAVKAAKKNGAKCGFDAEDLHRYEVNDDIDSPVYKSAKYLEDKYLDKVDYITASSPQIAGMYKDIYPSKKIVPILNVFSKKNKIKPRIINKHDPIKLFWFSQAIGYNRGIENIIKALQALSYMPFELHLLGHISPEAKKDFINDVIPELTNVYFHTPVPPGDLVTFASQFDIGLASEPGFSINNNLALSNKLFTYLQAGLAIIASNTTAQKNFIEENPGVGKIYEKHDQQSLIDILSDYQLNRELLFNTCEASLKTGIEMLNWENESQKFLSLVKKTLEG